MLLFFCVSHMQHAVSMSLILYDTKRFRHSLTFERLTCCATSFFKERDSGPPRREMVPEAFRPLRRRPLFRSLRGSSGPGNDTNRHAAKVPGTRGTGSPTIYNYSLDT